MTRAVGMSRRSFLERLFSATLAPGLATCRGTPTEPRYGSRLTARPGYPTRTPTKGETTPLGLGSDRDGYLYVPESYSLDTPMPLFVAMHGAGGESSNWQSYPARAEAQGLIVLAPDSRGTTWDAVRGTFGPDVEFLDAALSLTFERCRVDPDRITLGGFSDGASYALSLGPANGDLFTHVVAYSPGFYRSVELIGRPRMFVSHGRQDPILPYSNTAGRIVPSFQGAGYDVTFVSFDGGHSVPAEISDAALAWFLDESGPGSI